MTERYLARDIMTTIECNIFSNIYNAGTQPTMLATTGKFVSAKEICAMEPLEESLQHLFSTSVIFSSFIFVETIVFNQVSYSMIYILPQKYFYLRQKYVFEMYDSHEKNLFLRYIMFVSVSEY